MGVSDDGGVTVGVNVGVGVGVSDDDGVIVGVTVGVNVGVMVGVNVAVTDGVTDMVGVLVGVIVGVGGGNSSIFNFLYPINSHPTALFPDPFFNHNSYGFENTMLLFSIVGNQGWF